MRSRDWDNVITELRKPHGWVKGTLGSWSWPDGGVCLVGAIRRVLFFNPAGYYVGGMRNAQGVMERIVREQFPERVRHMGGTVTPRFNDHPDTTLDDVILVCEKARANADD